MNIESTELQNSTETAIGYIPCYQLADFNAEILIETQKNKNRGWRKPLKE